MIDRASYFFEIFIIMILYKTTIRTSWRYLPVLFLLLQYLIPNNPAIAGNQKQTNAESQFHACTYDGSPIVLNGLNRMARGDEFSRKVISEILRFSGLPQNFDIVISSEVPNAVAVTDTNSVNNNRFLVCNERFIQDVSQAANQSNWAPVSILVHEMAHHLSGHTLLAGGSTPSFELEADKLSGFILYKMGAKLNDSLKAANALAADTRSLATPGRNERLKAISEGWELACKQQSKNCTGNEIAGAPLSTPLPPSAPLAIKQKLTSFVEKISSSIRSKKNVSQPTATPGPATVLTSESQVDVLPVPDPEAIPVKFGKFVIDELGILDKATRAAFEKRMFEVAAQYQIECVTIVTHNLHGMTTDDYAAAMLRQLRVGKLDLGTGAVFVVAPKEKQAGIAAGSLVSLELAEKLETEKNKLKSFLEFSLPLCTGTCQPENTAMLFDPANHLTDNMARFNSMKLYSSPDDLPDATSAAADKKNIALTRIEGQMVTKAPENEGGKSADSIPLPKSADSGIRIQTQEGKNIQVYIPKGLEQIMPTPIQEGHSYALLVLDSSAHSSDKHLDILSYLPLTGSNNTASQSQKK